MNIRTFPFFCIVVFISLFCCFNIIQAANLADRKEKNEKKLGQGSFREKSKCSSGSAKSAGNQKQIRNQLQNAAVPSPTGKSPNGSSGSSPKTSSPGAMIPKIPRSQSNDSYGTVSSAAAVAATVTTLATHHSGVGTPPILPVVVSSSSIMSSSSTVHSADNASGMATTGSTTPQHRVISPLATSSAESPIAQSGNGSPLQLALQGAALPRFPAAPVARAEQCGSPSRRGGATPEPVSKLTGRFRHTRISSMPDISSPPVDKRRLMAQLDESGSKIKNELASVKSAFHSVGSSSSGSSSLASGSAMHSAAAVAAAFGGSTLRSIGGFHTPSPTGSPTAVRVENQHSPLTQCLTDPLGKIESAARYGCGITPPATYPSSIVGVPKKKVPVVVSKAGVPNDSLERHVMGAPQGGSGQITPRASASPMVQASPVNRQQVQQVVQTLAGIPLSESTGGGAASAATWGSSSASSSSSSVASSVSASSSSYAQLEPRMVDTIGGSNGFLSC